MTEYSYLIHRAVKYAKPSIIELQLIDRDLANAGIAIPSARARNDDWAARMVVDRIMQDVLG